MVAWKWEKEQSGKASRRSKVTSSAPQEGARGEVKPVEAGKGRPTTWN
jgi:hypothetical protein